LTYNKKTNAKKYPIFGVNKKTTSHRLEFQGLSYFNFFFKKTYVILTCILQANYFRHGDEITFIKLKKKLKKNQLILFGKLRLNFF
jgi:hypothetical protein